MNLELNQCRFADPDLVARYNRVGQALSDVTSEAPGFAEREEFSELLDRHGQLGVKLQHDYCRIVFLGPSQSGKSLAISNLLRLDEADGPSTTGPGGQNTATVTRLRGIPTDFPSQVSLQYMNEREFKSRLAAVCQPVGLDHTRRADELIIKLETLLDGNHNPNAHELFYLLRLLKSYQDPDARLGARVTRRVTYANRGQYLQPELDDIYALLGDVSIKLPTDVLSKEVEIIDVPGLAVQNKADDVFIDSLVGDLDGVLVFQKYEEDLDWQATELLKRLQEKQDRQLKVWLVITHLDSYTPLASKNDQPTSLDELNEALQASGVSSAEVLFLGNRLFQTMLQSEPNGQSASASVLTACQIPVDSSGRPVIPKEFERFSELAVKYEQVLEDGGIGQLRSIVCNEVPEAVRTRIQDTVSPELQDIESALIEILEASQKLRQVSRSAVRNAGDWSGDLSRLILTIRRDRKLFDNQSDVEEDPVNQVRKVLLGRLDRRLGGLVGQTSTPMQQMHVGLCADLQIHAISESLGEEESEEKVNEGCLHKMYRQIARQLSETSAGPIEFMSEDGPSVIDPRAKWNADMEEDLSSRDEWLTPVFSAFQEDEFPDVATISVVDYQVVMTKKIHSVVNAFVSCVIRRFENRLQEYLQQTFLVTATQQEDPQDSRALARVLRQLTNPES